MFNQFIPKINNFIAIKTEIIQTFSHLNENKITRNEKMF